MCGPIACRALPCAQGSACSPIAYRALPCALCSLLLRRVQKKMLRRPPTRMAIGSETDMDEYEKEKKQRKDEAKKAPVKLTTEQRIGLQK